MGQSTTVIPTGGGGAKVQDSIPTNPQKGDLWVDTSEKIPTVNWYDGTSFVLVESSISKVPTAFKLPISDPAQIYRLENNETYYRSNGGLWDISTLNTDNTTIQSQSSNAQSFKWKPNGRLLWIIDKSSDAIYEYDVSTAYDISTASYTGKSLSTRFSQPVDLEFKSDGTKMYEVDRDSGVSAYNLSTPWDISTASLNGNELTLTDFVPTGLEFKPDGTRLWEVGRSGDAIYEYDVSTAWDISTASYTGKSLNSQDAQATLITWKPDGTRLWEGGYDTNTAYEYDVSTPWDINTASLNGSEYNFGVTPGSISWKPDGSYLWFINSNEGLRQYFAGYETF